MNDIDYFCLTLIDNGFGDEEWRNGKNNMTSEILELITNNQGILHSINQANGVKYCLLLPQEKIAEKDNKENVFYLFPKF